MRRRRLIPLIVVFATASCRMAAATGPSLPNQIIVRADHSGWSSASTNLTLAFSNGVYAAGSYTVASPLVSNLLEVARRPWPKPATNSWPRFTIDAENLGLNAAWVTANYGRLLEAYSGKSGNGVFPNASDRQRAWLTNALADVDMLGDVLRGCFGGFWTDDYPSLEVRFENDDGQTIEQAFRLSTRAQQFFMLPWEVYDGTNEFTSANADISRAVVRILPPGFLLRDRLNGDLFQLIVGQFLGSAKVHDFLKKSVLQETFGGEADLFLQEFQPRNLWVSGGSRDRFPDSFGVTLHRTNWPERVTMPIQSGIERGVVTNLKAILGKADAKAAPLLKQEWLISRLKGSVQLSAELKAGSPDHQWLRGHMAKVGRAAFYDRIQPALRDSLGFVLREGLRRSSEWAVLEDGRMLLYGFTGDGVMEWKPEDLGFQGDERRLHSSGINFVGVFVGPDGKITEVVPPDRK